MYIPLNYVKNNVINAFPFHLSLEIKASLNLSSSSNIQHRPAIPFGDFIILFGP